MSVLTDLFAFLTTADTGGLDADRAAAIAVVRSMIKRDPPAPGQTLWAFYPDTLAEGAKLPALSYSLVSSSTEHIIDGLSDGLMHDRVQIDVWSELVDEREALAAAVIGALDGLAVAFMGSTEVNAILWDNAIDSFEPSRLQYRRMLDFHFHHN